MSIAVEISVVPRPAAQGVGKRFGAVEARRSAGRRRRLHPECPDLLVRAGIDASSVNPDAVEGARRRIAAAAQRLLLEHAPPWSGTPASLRGNYGARRRARPDADAGDRI